ncbi:MAG: HlyC/CorC family transporter [Verrucomicrobiaceae bacterium]|nr:MAG: HlyC/CorC family transporter [Verrucomicrobiaceae bacterium]
MAADMEERGGTPRQRPGAGCPSHSPISPGGGFLEFPTQRGTIPVADVGVLDDHHRVAVLHGIDPRLRAIGSAVAVGSGGKRGGDTAGVHHPDPADAVGVPVHEADLLQSVRTGFRHLPDRLRLEEAMAVGLTAVEDHGEEFPEIIRRGEKPAVRAGVAAFIPVVLARQHPWHHHLQTGVRLVVGKGQPLHLFYILFRPIIGLMNSLAALILRPFGIDAAGGHETAHSEDELRMLVMASGESGVLNETEVEIAGQVLGFADKTVEDVMVPRVDMVSLDAKRPLVENIERALASPFSRYPLIDGDHDEILGIVHIKDLFTLVHENGDDIRGICRETLQVPISKPLDLMLRDFQSVRTHMAVVQDEYGGVAGVVTLENVIEEIVGDIADESDPTERDIHPSGTDEWLIAGRVRLEKVNVATGLRLVSEEHDTVGGYVFEKLGRMPRTGDRINVEGYELFVQESDGRRVKLVRITRKAG